MVRKNDKLRPPFVRHDRILQFGKPERFGATGRQNDLLEVRTFVVARLTSETVRILTTMPSHRIIAYGESDEITCCIPGQYTVTVTSDITAEALTYNAIGGEG